MHTCDISNGFASGWTGSADLMRCSSIRIWRFFSLISSFAFSTCTYIQEDRIWDVFSIHVCKVFPPSTHNQLLTLIINLSMFSWVLRFSIFFTSLEPSKIHICLGTFWEGGESCSSLEVENRPDYLLLVQSSASESWYKKLLPLQASWPVLFANPFGLP